MHNYRSLILYAATFVSLSLAYLASPMSKFAVWQLFPQLEVAAQANPLLTAFVFLLMSVVLAFLAFPFMPVVYIAAGYYMSGMSAGVTILLGSVLGGLSAFLFYRRQIRRYACSLIDEHSSWKVWLTLFGLRLSPVVPAPLANFFAAIFHASAFQYLTTTVIGTAPLVLFYVDVGQQSRQLLSGGATRWQEVLGFLVILVLSTLLSAMGPWKSTLVHLKKLKREAELGPLSMQSAPSV